ncbi:hypothetical protein BGX28_001370 [Mortierella sp. GBA30]|nr:hypothetical protein BGX28_001370 [Mortierella sp. GBA30]
MTFPEYEPPSPRPIDPPATWTWTWGEPGRPLSPPQTSVRPLQPLCLIEDSDSDDDIDEDTLLRLLLQGEPDNENKTRQARERTRQEFLELQQELTILGLPRLQSLDDLSGVAAVTAEKQEVKEEEEEEVLEEDEIDLPWQLPQQSFDIRPYLQHQQQYQHYHQHKHASRTIERIPTNRIESNTKNKNNNNSSSNNIKKKKKNLGSDTALKSQ